MDNLIIQLKQLLIDIDAVARYRGDKFGVCDCIDNAGDPYPSHFLQDVVLAEIKKQGFKPSIKQHWLSKCVW